MQNLLRRSRIILPSEHGSWSLMLTPFIIGAGVSILSLAQNAIPAVLLCLVAVLALFLARQPINLWIRVQRGKARSSDGPVARFWAAALLLIAAGAGIGLLALGRAALLWLAIPALTVLILTLAMAVALGPRRLSTELLGVVGLALGGPAAYISGAGTLDERAWAVWGLTATHNLITLLYVRLRIDAQHERASQAQVWWVIIIHALSLAGVIGAALAGWLPGLVALPIGLLVLRALVAARHSPPIENVRRFGLTEMGLALAFALVVIAAFLLHG